MAEEGEEMKTPDEARQCWCPFARLLDGDQTNAAAATNRMGDKWGHTFCIADECMAWRWERDLATKVAAVEGDKGYCGLAGKP